MNSPGALANAEFGRLLRGGRREAVHGAPGRLLGLEHEYVVRGPNGVVDFRRLIGDLRLDGRRLDPGDRNAHRLADGSVVTADGREAEIAIPPIVRRPGFVHRLEASAAIERLRLAAVLPRGHSLDGYSTHLSVSMPGRLSLPASRLFLARFAPGLMLLADRVDSPGLLIRPRPGRLELAVEYVADEWLRAAAAYVAGAGAAIARALGGSRGTQTLPPALVPEAVVTADRFGWGVRRDAFGEDLLLAGRATALPLGSGGFTSAQAHLEAAWSVARQALAPLADASDLEATDRIVGGDRPLPVEFGSRSYMAAPTAAAAPAAASASAVGDRSPFGDILTPRSRPGYRVEAVFATWDMTVFGLESRGRRVFAAIPRPALARFLHRLDAGDLDETILAYLASTPTGSRLDFWRAGTEPALFDALGAPAALVAPEIGASGGTGDRVGKPGVTAPPTPVGVNLFGLRIPAWILGLVPLALLLLLAVLLKSGPNSGGTTTPTHTAPPSTTIPIGTSGGVTTPTSQPIPSQAPPPPFVFIAQNQITFGQAANFDPAKLCNDGGTVTYNFKIHGIADGTPVVVQLHGPGTPPSVTFTASSDQPVAKSYAIPPGGGSWADQIVTIGGSPPPSSASSASTVVQCTT